MAEADLKPVDPFGLWPLYRSAITGLGGAADPHKPDYAFHSHYVYPVPGRARFEIQFTGLQASRGTLKINLYALSDTRAKRKRAAKIELDLAQLAAQGGRIEMAFDAAAETAYAVTGSVRHGADATAQGLDLRLERPDDARRFVALLEESKDKISTAVTRGLADWWTGRSKLAAKGLIDTSPATLHGALSQMCTYRQLSEEPFARWMAALQIGVTPHRKLWEFAYILQVLEEQGKLKPGSRGLGFGVGAEAIPALLASMGVEVMATDLALDDGIAAGWAATGQHGDSLTSLERPGICASETFYEKVAYRSADMNAIPADLRGFDFCWSACAYEHLGSIKAGLRFVQQSVECLRPGGIAVHTSELNLVSNSDTVDHQSTVLFRRKDMEQLAVELTRAGHIVLPLRFDQGDQPPDDYVDIPPYNGDYHLKLSLRKYVTTSFGIAVIRGG